MTALLPLCNACSTSLAPAGLATLVPARENRGHGNKDHKNGRGNQGNRDRHNGRGGHGGRGGRGNNNRDRRDNNRSGNRDNNKDNSGVRPVSRGHAIFVDAKPNYKPECFTTPSRPRALDPMFTK